MPEPSTGYWPNPKTYDQVYDIWSDMRQKSALFADMPLENFAQLANTATGTQDYTAGLSNDLVKETNYYVNKLFGKLGGEWLGEKGRAAGGLLAGPRGAEIGQHLGEYVPRGAAETAAIFSGMWPLRALGAAAQGAQLYSQTDSPGAGVFGAALGLATPPIVHGAESLALKPFAQRLGITKAPLALTGGTGPAIWQTIGGQPVGAGTSTAIKAIEASARNVAFMGINEAQIQGASKISTGQWAPLSDGHLTEILAGQLAFAPLDILGVTRRRVPSRVEMVVQRAATEQARVELKAKAAAKQAAEATVDEIHKNLPWSSEIEEVVKSAGHPRAQEHVRMRLSEAHKKLSVMLAKGGELDPEALRHYLDKKGALCLLKGEAAQAVDYLIQDMVKNGDIEVRDGKIVPLKRYETAEGDPAVKSALAEQQLDAVASEVLAGKPQQASEAKVPLLITKEMEQTLLKMGHTQEAINKMTPQEAHTLVGQAQAGKLTAEPMARGKATSADEARATLKDEQKLNKWAEARGMSRKDAFDELARIEQGQPEVEAKPYGYANSVAEPKAGVESAAQRAATILLAGRRGTADVVFEAIRRRLVAAGDPAPSERKIWEALRRLARPAILEKTKESISTAINPEHKQAAYAAEVAQPGKRKLETEPAKTAESTFKGGVTKPEPWPEPAKYPAGLQIESVTSPKEAVRWVRQVWERVFKQVHGHFVGKVVKEVPVRDAQGKIVKEDVEVRDEFDQPVYDKAGEPKTRKQPVMREVSETGQLIGRLPDTADIDLVNLHRNLLDAANNQLKRLGQEPLPLAAFDDPPRKLALALGEDTGRATRARIAERIDELVQFVGSLASKRGRYKPAPEAAAKLQTAKFDKMSEIAVLEYDVESMLYRLQAEEGRSGPVAEALKQDAPLWHKDMTEIAATRRKANDTLDMYHNALRARAKRLQPVLDAMQERDVEQVMLAFKNDVATTAEKVLGEAGYVTRDREAEIERVVNEYVTKYGSTIKDPHDAKSRRQTHGPIVDAFLDVYYSEPLQKILKGAQTRRDDAASLFNMRAYYNAVNWLARLVEGFEAEKISPDLVDPKNLWTKYKSWVKGKKGKPGTQIDLSDYGIARAAMLDLVKLPMKKAEFKRPGARPSPAWEAFGKELGHSETQWWAHAGDDAYRLAMVDTSKSAPDEFVTVPHDPADEAALKAWQEAEGSRGGGDLVAGTESATFFAKMAELWDGLTITPETAKDAMMVHVVIGTDHTIDRKASQRRVMEAPFLNREQLQEWSDARNATIAILRDMGLYHMNPKPVWDKATQTWGLDIEIVPPPGESALTYRYAVVKDVGKTNSFMDDVHKFRYGYGSLAESFQALVNMMKEFNELSPEARVKAGKVELPAEVRQRAADIIKLTADMEARKKYHYRQKDLIEQERQRLNGELAEEWSKLVNSGEATPEWLVKKLDAVEAAYKDMVESQYKNWRNHEFKDVLEWTAGQIWVRDIDSEAVTVTKKQLAEARAARRTAQKAGMVEKPELQAEAMAMPESVSGMTDAAREARLARGLLDPEARRGQVAAGLKAFFGNYFTRIGLDQTQVDVYSNVAARIGAAFPNLYRGQVVEVTNPGYAGMFLKLAGSEKFAIGINPEQWAKLPPGEQAALMFQTAAHEMLHAFIEMGDAPGAPFAEAMAWATRMDPADRASVMRRVMSAVQPLLLSRRELQDYLAARANTSYESPKEFLTDFASLCTLGLIRPDTAQEIGANYLFSDVHMQNTMRGFFVPLLDMAKPVADYFRETLPTRAHAEFQGMLDRTAKMLDMHTEAIDAAFDAFTMLEASSPAGWVDLVGKGFDPYAALDTVDGLRRALEREKLVEPLTPGQSLRSTEALEHAAMAMFGPSKIHEESAGVEVAWPIKWGFTAGQLAVRYPALAPMFNLACAYYGMVNDRVRNMAMPLLKPNKWWRGEGWAIDGKRTGFDVVVGSQRAREAFDAIARLKQGTVEGGENLRVLTDSEMNRVMDDMGLRSEPERAAVRTLHRTVEQISPELHKMIIEMLVDLFGVRIGGAKAMHGPTGAMLVAGDAIKLGREQGKLVWDTMLHGMDVGALSADPDTQTTLSAIAAALEPVLEFHNRTKDGAAAFMPESRSDKWMIAYWEKTGPGPNDWKGGVKSRKTKGERDAALQELKNREAPNRASATVGQIVGIRSWDAWNRREQFQWSGPFSALHDAVVTGSLKKRLIDRLGAVRGKDVMDQIFADNWSPIDTALEQAGQRGATRLMRERQIAPGREDINMLENYLHGMTHIPRALSQMVVDAEAFLRLDDPSIRGEAELRTLAKHLYDNVVHPKAKEWTNTKKAIFAFYMAYNISSILIEPTQQFIVTMPMMTRDSGSVRAAHAAMAKAVRLSISKQARMFEDPDLQAAFEKAEGLQVFDRGAMQEVYLAEETAALNVASLPFTGKGKWTPGKVAQSLFNNFTNIGRQMYGLAPRMNNIAAFAANYLLARDHGVFVNGKLTKLTGDALLDHAVLRARASQGSGGLAARPVEPFHWAGQGAGIMGAAYSLMTYTQLVMSHLAKLGLDTINLRKNLTPQERMAAVKALGQTLTMQAAFAGVLGIPGAPWIMAILEQLFPLRANEAVRDGVEKLVGEDEEAGGFWTDAILRGLPFAGLGIDTSSRLALSNLLGVSAYDGFKLENLFGPGASMVGNMFEAVKLGAVGKTGDAIESILPVAFRNITSLYRDNGIVRDWQGRPVYEPTLPELVLHGLGLRPAGLTKVRDAQKMAKKADEIARTQNSVFYNEMARKLVEGDVDSVRTAIAARADKEPMFSDVEAARTIANKAMEMAFPLDFARKGVKASAAARQKLALQGGVQQATETQRLVTKKRLEAMLGVPGAGQVRPTDLREAQLIDALRMSNPLLSVQEARMQALVLLGRPPQRLGAVPIQ